jgi:hypothetical protein
VLYIVGVDSTIIYRLSSIDESLGMLIGRTLNKREISFLLFIKMTDFTEASEFEDTSSQLFPSVAPMLESKTRLDLNKAIARKRIAGAEASCY